MTCYSCKHWQGTRYSEWADCYWVIGHIEPRLFEEENEKGYKFTVPFDPHDIRLYNINSKFNLLYHDVMVIYPKKYSKWWESWGITIEKEKGKYFIQTRKDYRCKYYEDKTNIQS